MGANKLWQLLEPASIRISFHHHAVKQGFVGNIHGDRTLWVGIDASHWICAAKARHGQTQSPELTALHLRCERLAQLPVTPSFVFDGPERPNVKRDKIVRGNDHWLVEPFKEILDGYGFRHSVASGEAEVELARMSRAGIVDLVLTEDSDAMLFGAIQVARESGPEDSTKQTDLLLYRAEDVAAHPDLGFTTEDLIFVALLSGGDYSAGLQGCGIVVASELAQAGYGRHLIDGIRTLPSAVIGDFLNEWRQDLRTELLQNSSGHLGTRHASLASSIPDDFPAVGVLDLYINPAIHPGELVTDSCLSFSSGEPCAADFARFSASHFQWGRTAQALVKRYGDAFFPAMAVRQLIQAAVDIDKGRALADSGCPMIGRIVGRRKSQDTCFLEEVRVLLRVSMVLVRQICTSLPGPTVAESEMLKIRHTATKFRAWLPTDMVRIVLPARLAEFELRSPEKQKDKTPNVSKKRSRNATDGLMTGVSEPGSMPQTSESSHAMLPKQQKFTYDLTLSSGDEGTVPSDLSTAAAGNTVASSPQLGAPKSCSTGKHGRRTTMKVIQNSDGQEVWDISSEDCSDSGSSAAPPVKKLCKHGHRIKTTILHTAAGEEVWDISSEEYSYSGSEG